MGAPVRNSPDDAPTGAAFQARSREVSYLLPNAHAYKRLRYSAMQMFRSKPPGINPGVVLLDLNPQLGPVGTNPNKVLLDTNL
ncbi:hypothetical protein Taro_052557 [Colocasia esculenta]|uniref:Uncharacterized protein n=1 Tax=Colocasia esculenta TaxID=4460 RepID=A0A843XK50_COLES|nr:hypothetical protein [Colocasia esculenta]